METHEAIAIYDANLPCPETWLTPAGFPFPQHWTDKPCPCSRCRMVRQIVLGQSSPQPAYGRTGGRLYARQIQNDGSWHVANPNGHSKGYTGHGFADRFELSEADVARMQARGRARS